MDKKGEIPHWLMMVIYILVSLLVILGIYALIAGKLQDFLGWLEGAL
jgi:hypothetical protein